MVKSKRWSMKDYSLWIAVKDELKEVVRIGVPLLVVWLATNSPTLAVVGAAVGRLVLTGFEYAYKEYR